MSRSRVPGPDSSGGPGLAVPVAEAARRVGVTASTLRSWERRYGLAPTGRTAGGHRRYTGADLAALQQVRRLCGTGVSVAAAAARARTASAVAAAGPAERAGPPGGSGFAAAAAALHPLQVARVAERVLARSGARTAWDTEFAPALRAMGDRWASTGTGIECEHLASDTVQQVLARHARRLAPPRRPAVLAAAAPGEAHVLPLYALAAALAELRVASCVLSALPPPALHTAVAELRPVVVVLWSQTRATGAAGLLRDLVPRAAAVFAAGPGWVGARPPDRVPVLADLAAAVGSVTAWTASSAPG